MSGIKKPIFIFTLAVLLLSGAECGFTALVTHLQKGDSFLLYIFYYAAKLFAYAGPFMMLGFAWETSRRHTFAWATLPFGIYAVADLLLQLPLALLSYFFDPINPFVETYFSYALSSLVSSVLLFLLLVLGYVLFLQSATLPRARHLFTLRDGAARAACVAAASFTLYSLVLEIVKMVDYAKGKLYIISSEDVFDFTFTILFVLGTGVFAFFVSRLCTRFPFEQTEEND